MSGVLTLQIPPVLDARARRIAQALHRPVEQVLLETLDTALPRLDDVPPGMVKALAELPPLDDAALWQIARATLDLEKQEQLQSLMDISERPLTPQEAEQVQEIRAEIGRLTLLKAQAFVLLQQRGYPIPPP